MSECDFQVNLLVQIDAFGLPEVHRSNIIARVTREMELLFGGRAHVTQVYASDSSHIRHREVVEEQVQQVGKSSQVSTVRPSTIAAGSGLRPLPDNLLAMRLPFPGGPSKEGTT